MERSPDSTPDKCNENLFTAVLLLCGPDPEPENGKATPTYGRWIDGTEGTLSKFGVANADIDETVYAYIRWLRKRKLAWIPK